MLFQAYLLGDDDQLIPIGDNFDAKTSLEAVNQARELWPGLSPVISEIKEPKHDE